jgi:hypothetical protein
VVVGLGGLCALSLKGNVKKMVGVHTSQSNLQKTGASEYSGCYCS